MNQESPIYFTILEKIREIAEAVSNNGNDKNASLLSGSAGNAIFLKCYYKKMPNEIIFDNLKKNINNSIFAIENSRLTYTFCSGIAGIAWSLIYLSEQKLLDLGDDAYFKELDFFLYNCGKNDLENRNFDYLHGGLGVILYFLKRDKSPTSNDYLLSLTKLLFSQVKNNEDEIVWSSNFNITESINQLEEYNIGLAHGIPSIIIVLTKLYTNDIEKDKCQELLKGTIKWLLKQKLPLGNISIYPNIVTDEKSNIQPSRLAWCYGDLGIATALWQAGKSLKNDEWKTEAIEILKNSCKRKDLNKNSVCDAGICHGTAGIAQIYNRFYWETKLPEFKETANYWINETLKMAYHKDGLAGYKSWRGSELGWENKIGILEGITGIGLALLSHISDEDPNWDECLLLS